MAPLAVKIKHAGKVHDVLLDPDQPATVFKDAVYQVTGVPPDRMKVMIKGGVLKDDTEWRKVGPKEGQTFTVIGAAGELPKPPEQPVVFMEDMDDTSLAQALSLPVGLQNLGNTCYMNASLQALRAIPELQTALQSGAPSGLPSTLSNLYTQMSLTTQSVLPSTFLATLRQTFPQFAEQNRGSGGTGGKFVRYAQQDAEEFWAQLLNSLRDVPGLPGPSSGSSASTKKFVDQYMAGEMRRELKCDESPDEPPTVTFEKVLKIDCNISITTNFMLQGIKEALDQKIEKASPTLGRDAVYTSSSRLSRLPSYLTVHMVRFAWRRDIGRKAKIMRRVKFPTDFDALELVTDELKEKMQPLSTKLKEVEGDRSERKSIRKRAANRAVVAAGSNDARAGEVASDSTVPPTDAMEVEPTAELEDESVYRERELKELEALVHPDLKADVGCSVTGQYELIAIVTHKGAAADAGHYIGFVKKSAIQPQVLGSTPASLANVQDDEDWYKFDDDRVSIFPKDKLTTLDGGGEDSSAYVLLYKTKPLA